MTKLNGKSASCPPDAGFVSAVVIASIVVGSALLAPINQANAQQFWDGADTTSGNGAPTGGAGTWNAASSNWTDDAAGTNNQAYNPGPPAPTAIFGTVGGGVAVSGGQGITSLTFNVDGYTLSGSQLAIHDNGSTINVVNGGDTAIIANVLSNLGPGSGGLTKTGAGTLILSGANTYSGTTTVSVGTLTVSANSLGATAGDVTVSGGTLDLGGAAHTKGNVTHSLGTLQNGTFNVDAYFLSGGSTFANVNADVFVQTGGTIGAGAINADQRITAIGGAITNTGATGVVATNTGAGTVSVLLNAAGGVNNGAGRGVEVATVDGNIDVDGAGSVFGVNGGIVAVTQTGSINISGTGDSATTGVASSGTRDRAISAQILSAAANGSNVVINRTGAIQSNSTGTFNQGILVEHLGQGAGDVTITTGAGGISVSGGSSRGIHVNRDSTATGSGNITIDTRAGAISNTGTAATIGIFGALSSDGSGLFKIDSGAISTSNTTGHGILALVTADNSDIQVTTHGTITGGTKGVEASNGFDANGVILNNSLSGNVHVTTNAVIGDGTAAGNPEHGIVARGGNGVVEIDANANINADGQAIFAQIVGTGSIDIDTTGQTLTAGSVGIFVADLKTGQLDIVTGAVTGTALNGIEASVGTGVKNITTNGAVVGGQDGIKAVNSAATGKITVTADENVTANNNRAINLETGSGDIDVLGTGNITGKAIGLIAITTSGNIHISQAGTIKSTNGDALAAITTSGNVIIDGNGNVEGRSRAINGSSVSGSVTISGTGATIAHGFNTIHTLGAITATITGGANQNILINRTGAISKTTDAGNAPSNRGIYAVNSSTGIGKVTIDLSGGTGVNFGSVVVDGVGAAESVGIYAERHNGSGKIDIDSGSVAVSGNQGFGIEGLGFDGSSVEITNHGTINGGHIGIGGFTFGSGDVTIVTAAEIGDTTAPAASGIHARADGSGNVSVTANNNVTSAGEGIHVDNALNNGTGNATVTGSGTVAGSSRGIDARTTTGAITIGGTGATSASGAASNTIFASTTNGGANNLVINRSGAITNTGSGNTKGIVAQHIGNGAGNLNITTGAGGITVGGNNGMGISAYRDATAAGTGNVNVDTQAGAITINGTGTAGGNNGHTDGIAATIRSNGTGVVTINAGVITTNNTTGRGIFAYTSADDSDIDVITHGVITGGQVGVEATNGFTDSDNSGILLALRNGTIHVTTNAVIGDAAAVNNLNYGVITRSGNGATEVDVNATIIADFSGVLSIIKGNGSIDIDTSGQSVTGGEIGVRVAELGNGQADIVTGTTTGTDQDGIFVAGTGVKNITTGGATIGGDNGISAVNGAGTGKVTVTANASVTGTTEDGVVVETGTGDIDVKGTGAVSGNTHGINAETTTGAISVTGTGASSASGNTTNAIRTRMSATTSTANGITINRTGDATTTGTGATRTVNAVRQNAGAGNISVTVGNVTDNNGTAAFGVDVFMENIASSGQVIVNTTAGTVDMNGGGASKGIYAVTDGSGKIDVDSGAVDTNNTTGHGIHAVSSFSNGANAAAIEINTAGAITGGAIGIEAEVRNANGAGGTIDITTAADIGGGGSGSPATAGIKTSARDGATNITLGGNLTSGVDGIRSTATGTGSVTVANNGNINVTNNAGSEIKGVVVATQTGAISISGSGTVTTTSTGGVLGNVALRGEMSSTGNSGADGITINQTGDLTLSGHITRVIQAVKRSFGSGDITVTAGNITETHTSNNSYGITTSMLHADSTGNTIINTKAGAIDMDGALRGRGISAVANGTGKIDIDAGAIDIESTAGIGIEVIFGQGSAAHSAAIEIDTFGAITGGAFGINAVQNNAGATGTITINTGADIGGSGSGNAATAGIKTATRDGNTLITLGGNVSSAGDGIKSDATGTGTVTITGTGDITGGSDAGDDGIDVTAQGAVTVSVNGTITGDPGIVISSANGPIDVTGTGNVIGNGGDGISTTITNAGANGAITINRDGTVTGTISGISAGNLGTGNVNITTAKAVTGGTKAAIAASTQAGLSTITLNAGANVSSTSGLAIFNNAGNSTTTVNNGASVTGEITLGDGDDNLTFANGGFNNVTVFDGGDDISVADGFEDILTLNGAGAVTAANIRNWEQFNVGGALTVNGGGTLGAGTTTINNGGTLDAGNALVLAGKMVIAAGGTFNGTGGGAGVFSSTGNVTNSGSITLADGTPGDVFTVNGNYTGGGSVSLDTELNDGVIDKTDRFDITGNSAGATVLNVNVSGGAGGSTGSGVADGIQVVTVGGTSAGTFTLGNSVSIGAFNYDLVQADGQNWFLQSGTVTNQVATYSAMQSTFQQGMATYRQRLGQRVAGGRSNQAVVSPVAHLFKGEGGTSQSGSGFWMKSGYSDITAVGGVVAGGVVTKPEFHTRQTTIQIGYDKQLYKAETSKFVMGLFGEYKHTDQTVNNAANSQVSTSKSDAYGGGVSATWFNPSGIYADFVGQLAIYDVKITDKVTGSTAKPDVFSYSASTEIGYRIGVSDVVRFVPQAQIMLGSAVVDNFTDSTGVNVKTQNKTRFTGRLGLGLEFTMPGATPENSFTGYGVASVIHDFSGKYRFTAAGTDIETKINPTRLEGVLGGNWRTGKLRLFGELGVSHSFSNKKYVGYKGTAGLEVAF